MKSLISIERLFTEIQLKPWEQLLRKSNILFVLFITFKKSKFGKFQSMLSGKFCNMIFVLESKVRKPIGRLGQVMLYISYEY